jgi:hypothetical protein
MRKSVSTNVLPYSLDVAVIEKKIEYQAVLRAPFHQIEACSLEHANKSLDSIFSDDSNYSGTDDDTTDLAACLACPPDYEEVERKNPIRPTRASILTRDPARVVEWMARIRRQKKNK